MAQPTLPSTDDLQAYLDGRLDSGHAATIEQWLADHPEEADRMEQHRRISDALHLHYDGVLNEPVPSRLHAVLLARPRYALARAAMWAAVCAGIGLATGLAGGWLLGGRGLAGSSADLDAPMVMRAAIVHATYSPEVRHPVEVGADQEAHLSAWLSKRLGHAVRPPNLEAQGFSLVGGRLLPGERGDPHSEDLPPPTAHFMYQCNMGRRVTLYVRPEPAHHNESALRFARQANVNIVYWSEKELGYALSSVAVGREELQRVADLAYRQLNP